MNFVNYITTVLLSLQPSYGDGENWEQRQGRMEIIAKAIDDATSKATCTEKYNVPGCEKIWNNDKKSLALLLVTKGYWESKFAKNVHEGKCRKYECDAYTVNGKVAHRARSLWQIQRTTLVNKDEYSKMNSSTFESTKMSAIVASRYLAEGMKKCNTIEGTIAVYGGAKTCTWVGAKQREQFYKMLEKRNSEQLLIEVEKQKILLSSRKSKKKEMKN